MVNNNLILVSAAVMAVLLTILMTPLRLSTINLVDKLLMGGGMTQRARCVITALPSLTSWIWTRW